MKPSFLKRFIKKLTRERVVPTISARVSFWEKIAVSLSDVGEGINCDWHPGRSFHPRKRSDLTYRKIKNLMLELFQALLDDGRFEKSFERSILLKKATVSTEHFYVVRSMVLALSKEVLGRAVMEKKLDFQRVGTRTVSAY